MRDSIRDLEMITANDTNPLIFDLRLYTDDDPVRKLDIAVNMTQTEVC